MTVDYDACRKNMVECQLCTNGIIDEDIIRFFEDIPREFFLPDEKKPFAYVDEDIMLDEDEFLLEPLIHARLLQLAELKKSDVMLNIGDSTGYVSAVAANLVGTVVTIEKKAGLLDRAREIWAAHSTCNVATVEGVYVDGSPENGPYDVILINGAVVNLPEKLKDQLAVNGKLLYVHRPTPLGSGKIKVITRVDENEFSEVTYHDSSAPYVDGFAPEEEFVF